MPDDAVVVRQAARAAERARERRWALICGDGARAAIGRWTRFLVFCFLASIAAAVLSGAVDGICSISADPSRCAIAGATWGAWLRFLSYGAAFWGITAALDRLTFSAISSLGRRHVLRRLKAAAASDEPSSASEEEDVLSTALFYISSLEGTMGRGAWLVLLYAYFDGAIAVGNGKEELGGDPVLVGRVLRVLLAFQLLAVLRQLALRAIARRFLHNSLESRTTDALFGYLVCVGLSAPHPFAQAVSASGAWQLMVAQAGSDESEALCESDDGEEFASTAHLLKRGGPLRKLDVASLTQFGMYDAHGRLLRLRNVNDVRERAKQVYQRLATIPQAALINCERKADNFLFAPDDGMGGVSAVTGIAAAASTVAAPADGTAAAAAGVTERGVWVPTDAPPGGEAVDAASGVVDEAAFGGIDELPSIPHARMEGAARASAGAEAHGRARSGSIFSRIAAAVGVASPRLTSLARMGSVGSEGGPDGDGVLGTARVGSTGGAAPGSAALTMPARSPDAVAAGAFLPGIPILRAESFRGSAAAIALRHSPSTRGRAGGLAELPMRMHSGGSGGVGSGMPVGASPRLQPAGTSFRGDGTPRTEGGLHATPHLPTVLEWGAVQSGGAGAATGAGGGVRAAAAVAPPTAAAAESAASPPTPRSAAPEPIPWGSDSPSGVAPASAAAVGGAAAPGGAGAFPAAPTPAVAVALARATAARQGGFASQPSIRTRSLTSATFMPPEARAAAGGGVDAAAIAAAAAGTGLGLRIHPSSLSHGRHEGGKLSVRIDDAAASPLPLALPGPAVAAVGVAGAAGARGVASAASAGSAFAASGVDATPTDPFAQPGLIHAANRGRLVLLWSEEDEENPGAAADGALPVAAAAQSGSAIKAEAAVAVNSRSIGRAHAGGAAFGLQSAAMRSIGRVGAAMGAELMEAMRAAQEAAKQEREREERREREKEARRAAPRSGGSSPSTENHEELLASKFMARQHTATAAAQSDDDVLPPLTLDHFTTLFHPSMVDPERAFALFDVRGCGTVLLSEFVTGAEKIYEDIAALDASLDGKQSVVTAVSTLLWIAFSVAFMAISLLVFDMPLKDGLWAVGSVLVSASFAVGPSISACVNSLVFLLLIRPFDVGDRVAVSCLYGGEEMLLVKRCDVLTTTFQRTSSKLVTIGNHLLAQAAIENFRRSPPASVRIDLVVAFDTSRQQLGALQRAVERFLDTDRKSFKPGATLRISGLTANGLGLSVWISTLLSWSDAPKTYASIFRLWVVIVESLKAVGIRHQVADQRLLLEAAGMGSKHIMPSQLQAAALAAGMPPGTAAALAGLEAEHRAAGQPLPSAGTSAGDAAAPSVVPTLGYSRGAGQRGGGVRIASAAPSRTLSAVSSESEGEGGPGDSRRWTRGGERRPSAAGAGAWGTASAERGASSSVAFPGTRSSLHLRQRRNPSAFVPSGYSSSDGDGAGAAAAASGPEDGRGEREGDATADRWDADGAHALPFPHAPFPYPPYPYPFPFPYHPVSSEQAGAAGREPGAGAASTTPQAFPFRFAYPFFPYPYSHPHPHPAPPAAAAPAPSAAAEPAPPPLERPTAPAAAGDAAATAAVPGSS